MEDDPNAEGAGAHSSGAFAQLVAKAVVQIEGGQGPDQALLFTGNRHYSVPARLINEATLSPVDKIIWLVICQHAGGNAKRAAFPSYEQLQRDANVGSSTTIARSLHVLRITRWLSLCARVRDDKGQFRGNIYALHDEPLPISEAVRLDEGYLDYLERSVAHEHSRIARAAKKVAQNLDVSITGGRDILAFESNADRRARRERARKTSQSERSPISPATISQTPSPRPESHHLYQVKAGSSSCNSNNNITTTTPRRTRARVAGALEFPQQLDANQRSLAERYLGMVEPELQQPVLDELAGRLDAERLGAEPVWDRLRYLYRLCLRARDGEFEPNLGIEAKPVEVTVREPVSGEDPLNQLPLECHDESQRRQWRARFAALGKDLGVPQEADDD